MASPLSSHSPTTAHTSGVATHETYDSSQPKPKDSCSSGFLGHTIESVPQRNAQPQPEIAPKKNRYGGMGSAPLPQDTLGVPRNRIERRTATGPDYSGMGSSRSTARSSEAEYLSDVAWQLGETFSKMKKFAVKQHEVVGRKIKDFLDEM